MSTNNIDIHDLYKSIDTKNQNKKKPLNKFSTGSTRKLSSLLKTITTPVSIPYPNSSLEYPCITSLSASNISYPR